MKNVEVGSENSIRPEQRNGIRAKLQNLNKKIKVTDPRSCALGSLG